VELPQEYWHERTLKEIASAIGTPIDIDGPTRNRTFRHYARILVDIDLSKRIYDEILVEREGFAFKVEVQYERRPLFCHHCHSIGHNVASCRWLHPQTTKDKIDRGKQIVVAETAPKHPPRQNKTRIDVGASTSTNGSNGIWIPILVVSTVTTTQRVPVIATSTHIPSASGTLALPSSFPTPTSATNSHLRTVVTSSVATSQIDRNNNFSIPLHNVFDLIAPRELPHNMPVLEPVSLVAHDDVQNVEVTMLNQKSREVLKNPSVTELTDSLLENVEYNHMSPRELVESPKDSNVHDTHSSPLGCEDIRPIGVEQTNQTSREGLEIPVVDGVSESLQDGVEKIM